ncbi:PTS sugar transporter subunit IIC [Clostridium felsineum]|uniref:PTS sugar transporter subunit IIC n=1 Tax=Clostridium felsineum TaxID=36839 RepID=UPI00098BEE3B|nr:PTS transporter subunit EIIC [Clostridium felsineum]URZ04490.1 PTS system oligo-beta-mannoside-specific EIIC component [Clostridium felsineum]
MNSKFINKLEGIMMPIANKVSSNKYLLAMRDAFSTLLPFIIVGSLFGIFNWVILDPNGTIMGPSGLNLGHKITGLNGKSYDTSNFVTTLTSIQYMCNLVLNGAFNVFSLLLVISFGYRLGKIWGSDKFLSAMLCLVSYLILTPQSVQSIINKKSITIDSAFAIKYFGSNAVLTAILVTTFVAFLFAKLTKNDKLKIKMPDGVPPAVVQSFESLLPTGIILFIVALIAAGLHWINQPALNDLIYTAIGAPLMGFSQGFGFAIAYQFLVWIFWWFGIHGHNVTAVIQNSVYFPAQLSNQTGATHYIFTNGFFEAGLMHVMGLVIAILIFSKKEDWKAVVKVAGPSMLFNIQEPMAFGLPIVLNPLILVPYIVAPLVNVIIGAIAISLGIVPVFRYVVPWTMPLFFGALIGTGSLAGGLLQVVWLIVDTLIYAPFVIAANKTAKIQTE